jgi:hypothetical protein
MILKLEGLTGHGKNRIREHGEHWEVLKFIDGGRLLITAMESTDVRWIESVNDVNFSYLVV